MPTALLCECMTSNWIAYTKLHAHMYQFLCLNRRRGLLGLKKGTYVWRIHCCTMCRWLYLSTHMCVYYKWYYTLIYMHTCILFSCICMHKQAARATRPKKGDIWMTHVLCYRIIWALSPCRIVFAHWDQQLQISKLLQEKQASGTIDSNVHLMSLVSPLYLIPYLSACAFMCIQFSGSKRTYEFRLCAYYVQRYFDRRKQEA